MEHMASRLWARDGPVQTVDFHPKSTASKESFVLSSTLAMIAISVVSFCLARRAAGIASLRNLPLARWLILAIFIDSWAFVFSSTVLQASFGLNSSAKACDVGILLCLVCYLSSKLIYMFLVEKVYIIRGTRKRWQDGLFLFNTFGMLLPYCIVVTLTFVYRNAVVGSDGQCRIGLKLQANLPLLVFDIVINVYLTYLFLIPLRGLWSFRNGSESKQGRLHRVALRTFIGSCSTLLSTLANLTALLILKGHEPGWVCFAACNADVLFSVLVLHWVTHQDDYGSSTLTRCGACKRSLGDGAKFSRSIGYLNSAGRLEAIEVRSAGGQVVTNCEAGKHNHSKSIPLNAILANTEFRRDVESRDADSYEELSEMGSSSKRVGSMEQIRPHTGSS